MKRACFLLSVFVIFSIFSNCAGDPIVDEPFAIQKDVSIVSPANKEMYTIGDPLKIEVEVNHPDLIDELELYINDSLYMKMDAVTQSINIVSEQFGVGYMNIYLKYKDGSGKEHRDNRQITFFSDIKPDVKECSGLTQYPHRKESYTQGLEFYKGRLYEGTGQYGASVLAEVDLKTGQHVRSTPLSEDIFGEGITIMNDTIYQISYRSGRCFLYDMAFNSIGEFTYQGEGWGLCNNGKEIIMSNGSSEIVWRDPRTFAVTKKLQVFDDQTNVTNLNELELVNGRLFANIYTDNRIVEIDTTTGKVLAYNNFAKLAAEQPAGVDYFNGIASQNGKIYVTGKWWPSLYEISCP